MDLKNNLIVLVVQLNGKMMNNKDQNKKSFINLIATFIKENLKYLIFIFSIIFLCFLVYQGYSYYKINKVNKLSISYFTSKNLEDEIYKYSEINKLTKEKGFFSILSKLELIKKNIDNGDFDLSLKLYEDILNLKNMNNKYLSLVAINAAYNFINISFKNKNNKYIENINRFISLIDDSLDNFIGNKNELLYLVSILSLNSDSDYKNNSELLTLYDNIMSDNNISSSIKERVKKIHEFYIFI